MPFPFVLFRQPEWFKTRRPGGRTFVLAIMCSAQFIDLVNLSAVTMALPVIQKELGVDKENLQWVISAYALTFGSFLLLGGRCGDLFGHRGTLLAGIIIFSVFSLGCALTSTFISLVVMRAFQGIGAAFTIPSAQAYIALSFTDPAEKANALGLWALSGSLGFVLGLIIGGVLTQLIGWHWIFWISFILCGFMLLCAFIAVPETPSGLCLTQPQAEPELLKSKTITEITEKSLDTPRQRFLKSLRVFDVLGIFLAVPGVLIFTYALTAANSKGWGNSRIIAMLVISVALLVAFIFHERTASHPLVTPRLFSGVTMNVTLVLGVLMYSVRQGCTYFLTIQLQGYGNSPLKTALYFLTIGATSFTANQVAGRLMPILGTRIMFIAGWVIAIPGVLLFSFIDESSPYWRFAFPGMILYMAGICIVYVTANFVVVSIALPEDQGTAAGVFNVALQVGGSILGLVVLTEIAQALDDSNMDTAADTRISESGLRAVYYTCIVLSGVGLLLSVCAIGYLEIALTSKKEDAEEKAEESS